MKKTGLTNHLLAILLILAASQGARAQKQDNNSFGGWHFLEVSHKFEGTPWSTLMYFEHENFQYQRLDCWYLRSSVGYKVFPWLKTSLGYDYLKQPETYGHRIVCDLTGTLSEGRLSTALRFRYLHTWKPEADTRDNELRTRLIVVCSVPQLHLTPYMAVELFTWGSLWKRSRHYIACAYDITNFMQVEGFYMLTFSSHDPQQILGLGLNFNI